MFEVAEGGLAAARKNFRDGQAGVLFNLLIEVEEVPGELRGEEPADGGLAGAHEADQTGEFAPGLGTGRHGRRIVRVEQAIRSAQSRFRILIVPLKDESSTLALP